MDEHQDRRTHALETPLMNGILEALREEMPGFEVIRRDVDLAAELHPDHAHPMRADWMGRMGSGRRVLVGVHDEIASSTQSGTDAERDDEAILWAVEAVACASRMQGGDERVRGHPSLVGREPMPLVVLIVPSCSTRLTTVLALLPADAFLLLELQSRTASTRSKPRLLRRDLGTEDTAPENGIEGWPVAERERAESLASRMRRIDPSIERTDSEHGLFFRYRDEDAAMLTLFEGKLLGASGSESDFAAIEDESGAEAWLERALRSHGQRLLSGVRRARPADLLSRSGPLLSAEELAAFRDD